MRQAAKAQFLLQFVALCAAGVKPAVLRKHELRFIFDASSLGTQPNEVLGNSGNPDSNSDIV